MSRLTAFSGFVVAGLMATMTPAPLGGHTIDKLTYLTFNGQVQIPGATLDAGTYRFRLTNPNTSRNVLQVLSHDGSTVYAMFHTMVDSRMEVTDDSMVTFRETPAGVPPAIKSLFYGGERRGYEFVYSGGGPVMVAEEAPQPELIYTTEPVTAEPEVAAEPEPALPIESEVVAEPMTEPMPELVAAELPRTGSPIPAVALSGLAALVLGLGAGLLGRRLG